MDTDPWAPEGADTDRPQPPAESLNDLLARESARVGLRGRQRLAQRGSEHDPEL